VKSRNKKTDPTGVYSQGGCLKIERKVWGNNKATRERLACISREDHLRSLAGKGDYKDSEGGA